MSRKSARNRRAEVPKQERREETNGPPRKRGPGDYFTPEWVTAWGTMLLAVLAFFAWREATEGTKAMQGQNQAMQAQLQILQAEQEPTIDITHEGPTFDPVEGKIHWNIYFQNVGKGAAYEFKHEAFMKTGKQFADAYGGGASYVLLDNLLGSTFISGQKAFVTLVSQDTYADEPSAHKVLDSGDLAVMIHFRFKVAQNGGAKDQWFCSGKTGDFAIFDYPPVVCWDWLPIYIPRPAPTEADEQARKDK